MTTDTTYTEREALRDLLEAARFQRPPDPRGPEDKRREAAAKNRLKEWMEEEGVFDLRDDETGIEGHLQIPEELWVDRTDGHLTADVVFRAFRAGMLTLNVSAYRAHLKLPPTPDFDVFKQAVHEGSGTPRLTVKEGQAR